ncbi:hypothetical protein Tco_0151554 [Tanacetum coccineum]
MAMCSGCEHVKLPFGYLGLMVGDNMTRMKVWKCVIEKVTSKLSNWKEKTLSIGGRLTLLKSMLGANPTYYMSLFKDSEGVLTNTKTLRNRFYLGADVDEKKMSWVAWKPVISAKKNRGLGVNSMFALNRALLFKWIWIFLTEPEAFLVRVVKEIHGLHGVNKGDVAFIYRFHRIYALENQNNIYVAKKMSQAEWNNSFCRMHRGDRWRWTKLGSGEFTVASARSFIDDYILLNTNILTRWSPLVHIKVCDKGIESTDHLFFGCELDKEMMVEVRSWWSLDIPSINSFLNWQVWFEALHMSKVKKDCLEVVFLTLWWHVWKFCNASLFAKKKPKRSLCMDIIFNYALLWINDRSGIQKDGFTKEVFKDPAVYKTVVDQFPTPGEMVRVESLSDDQLAAKMSVMHCMMMSHGGELLARYRGLNQSHQSADSRLKGYEEKVASLTGLELQVSTLNKQVSRLNDKLSSSDASFAKSKAKVKERKKKIKSLTKSLDNLHPKVAHLSANLNRATVLEAKKDEEILRLKATPPDKVQGELLSLASSAGFERRLSMHQTKDEFAAMLKKMANFMPGAQDRLVEASSFLNLKYWLVQPTSPPSRDARISPPTTKESTVTPASKSLKLFANVDLTNFVVASEHNEEMVNAEVDGSNPKMTDDTVAAKSGHAFVQGIYVALEDVIELVKVGSGRASSGPNDVVISLFAGEKGDGLVPSSVAGEEAAANSSRV